MMKKVLMLMATFFCYKQDGDKLRERNIKSCTCCYLDDLININDIDFENIISDEKLYENTCVYYLCLLQNTYSVKPLRAIFHKIIEYIKDYDESKYLALISSSKKDKVC